MARRPTGAWSWLSDLGLGDDDGRFDNGPGARHLALNLGCPMEIRKATRDDAAAIHDLHTRSIKGLWGGHYSESQIEGWTAGRSPEGYVPAISRGEMFVAEGASGLLGFGHATGDSVEAIFVDPDVAGTGVGTALLGHALALIGKHGAGPIRLTSTLNAVSFYRRFGFRVMGERSIEKGRISVPVVDMELSAHPN